jgi:hypothetical protein
MSSPEKAQACLDILKQNFGSNLGHGKEDGPGFAELVLSELLQHPDAIIAAAVDSLKNMTTGRLLVGHVRAAIQTAREKLPQEQEAHHEPDTFICPHCQDQGVQLVLVEGLGRLYDVIEPCPGYLGRPCPAGDAKKQQMRNFADGHGRRAVTRLPYLDIEAHKTARAAFAARQHAGK